MSICAKENHEQPEDCVLPVFVRVFCWKGWGKEFEKHRQHHVLYCYIAFIAHVPVMLTCHLLYLFVALRTWS